MAEPISFRPSLNLGSEHVPEFYCEPCYEVRDKIKLVAGYCQNCNENLCLECYTGHLRREPFQDHKLVDKSTRPKTKSATQTKLHNTGLECHLHHGETIHFFCQSHYKLGCKICLTLNHLACKTEEISKLARNIQDSQELQRITNHLHILKNNFKYSLGKTETNKSVIQKNHSAAIKEMKKLREEFDKLMTATVFQADKVKEEDFNKIQKLAATCDIMISQISILTTNIKTMKEKGEMERLFVSMKHAESQLKSLEENLEKMDKENTVREYKFKADVRLKALFNDCKILGQLLSERSVARIPQLIKFTSLSDQKKKRPTHLKDIIAKSPSDNDFIIYGSLVLPNKQILITDWDNSKLKLIDTNRDRIISELKLSSNSIGITKIKDNEVAVTIQGSSNKVQFVTLSQNTLSMGREISANEYGWCKGIAYNNKTQTLLVAYYPPKIEILNMAGTVIKCLDKDSKGDKLFDKPRYVALSPIMTEMFVTDYGKGSVIRMTISGEIKAVYKDKSLKGQEGICVHRSGLVYVVGYLSHTVHQLDPNSGKFKLLLEQKDGLFRPRSISYCELEDKMYIGMGNSILKVFQMK